MRGRSLLLWVTGLSGCGLPQCEALCSRNATCTEQEIEELGSSWEEFTGYADREAYEASCMAKFEESHEQGSSYGELERTCHQELEEDPCGSAGS
jgi:hypothetical protein